MQKDSEFAVGALLKFCVLATGTVARIAAKKEEVKKSEASLFLLLVADFKNTCASF